MIKFVFNRLARNPRVKSGKDELDEEELERQFYQDPVKDETTKKKSADSKVKKPKGFRINIYSEIYNEVNFNRELWTEDTIQLMKQWKVKWNYDFELEQLILKGKSGDNVEAAAEMIKQKMEQLWNIEETKKTDIQQPIRPKRPSRRVRENLTGIPPQTIRNSKDQNKPRKSNSCKGKLNDTQVTGTKSDSKIADTELEEVLAVPQTDHLSRESVLYENSKKPTQNLNNQLSSIDISQKKQGKNNHEKLHDTPNKAKKKKDASKRMTLMSMVESNEKKNQSVIFHNGEKVKANVHNDICYYKKKNEADEHAKESKDHTLKAIESGDEDEEEIPLGVRKLKQSSNCEPITQEPKPEKKRRPYSSYALANLQNQAENKLKEQRKKLEEIREQEAEAEMKAKKAKKKNGRGFLF